MHQKDGGTVIVISAKNAELLTLSAFMSEKGKKYIVYWVYNLTEVLYG